MDEKDLLILQTLRKNGRTTISTISRRTRIPISTVFDKVKKYETYLIPRYVALIDFRKMGYSIRNQMIIKADQTETERLKKFLQTKNEVNNLSIAEDKTIVLEGIFRDREHLAQFRKELKNFNITDTKEVIINQEIKKESFMVTNS